LADLPSWRVRQPRDDELAVPANLAKATDGYEND
jgi:hypothetical protein